jgi:hypothetical protein
LSSFTGGSKNTAGGDERDETLFGLAGDRTIPVFIRKLVIRGHKDGSMRHGSNDTGIERYRYCLHCCLQRHLTRMTLDCSAVDQMRCSKNDDFNFGFCFLACTIAYNGTSTATVDEDDLRLFCGRHSDEIRNYNADFNFTQLYPAPTARHWPTESIINDNDN